jgi:hypothetical protein
MNTGGTDYTYLQYGGIVPKISFEANLFRMNFPESLATKPAISHSCGKERFSNVLCGYPSGSKPGCQTEVNVCIETPSSEGAEPLCVHSTAFLAHPFIRVELVNALWPFSLLRSFGNATCVLTYSTEQSSS